MRRVVATRSIERSNEAIDSTTLASVLAEVRLGKVDPLGDTLGFDVVEGLENADELGDDQVGYKERIRSLENGCRASRPSRRVTG